MRKNVLYLLLGIFLCCCVLGRNEYFGTDFQYMPIKAGRFDIAVWGRVTAPGLPVRIYIEGDGYAFNAYGNPTRNPTPRSTMLREMVARDTSENVVYLGRPCQYIMSDSCTVSDWTGGRFSDEIIASMSAVVKEVAKDSPVILIGYSGGALLSGLIIEKNPDLDIKQWITIAGVLNHTDWTAYFHDTPLLYSQDLYVLPRVSSCHYVAENDKVVPYQLSKKWTGDDAVIIVPGSRHNDFNNFVPRCDK